MLIRFMSAGVIVSCLRAANIATFSLSLMSTNALTAPVETVIYSFKGAPTDGANSLAKLTNDNGVLYGITNSGGINNNGTVFKLTLEAQFGSRPYFISSKAAATAPLHKRD